MLEGEQTEISYICIRSASIQMFLYNEHQISRGHYFAFGFSCILEFIHLQRLLVINLGVF